MITGTGTPADRTDGRGSISHTVMDSPLGPITLAGDGDVLTGVYLAGDRRRIPAERIGREAQGGFADARRQLSEYFEGSRERFELALRLDGDTFALRVWTLLQQIPYGQTRSYGQLATELGAPQLARAVGHANARNPISIIVPCHRVIGGNGSLTGYAAGLERKRWLLDHERGLLVDHHAL